MPDDLGRGRDERCGEAERLILRGICGIRTGKIIYKKVYQGRLPGGGLCYFAHEFYEVNLWMTPRRISPVLSRPLDFIVNWGRKNSLWPFPYGTACCAIEFMSTESSRYDLSRIGSEFVRFTPRQSDVLLVSGTITYKASSDPEAHLRTACGTRWVIIDGRLRLLRRLYDCYCTLPGIDNVIPVDVYIGGCPPRRGPCSMRCSNCRRKFRTSPT